MALGLTVIVTAWGLLGCAINTIFLAQEIAGVDVPARCLSSGLRGGWLCFRLSLKRCLVLVNATKRFSQCLLSVSRSHGSTPTFFCGYLPNRTHGFTVQYCATLTSTMRTPKTLCGSSLAHRCRLYMNFLCFRCPPVSCGIVVARKLSAPRLGEPHTVGRVDTVVATLERRDVG